MKRRFFSIITALALCLSLLPTWAMAETVADVAAGAKLPENFEGNTINTVEAAGTIILNSGTVSTNNGTIETNNGTVRTSAGEVGTNRGTISEVTSTGRVNLNDDSQSGARRANIDSNDGYIGTNKGDIGSNTGEVQSNYGTVGSNYGSGKINSNDGTVAGNSATVGTNIGYVTNQNQNAVVNINTGTVSNGIGTVRENKSGGIVFNTGTVVNNEPGGTVYNNFVHLITGDISGTVTNNSGDVYWRVTGNTDSVTFSPELIDPDYNQCKFIQEGCTITPPDGYVFSTPPTAANATLTPSGNGYTITNITAAPVELTVSTAASDGIVAKVEQNGTLSYYGDFMEAWSVAEAKNDVPATITLLADADASGELHTVLNTIDITLDGSGHTLNTHSVQFSIGRGKLTLQNCTILPETNSFLQIGGQLELKGCTIETHIVPAIRIDNGAILTMDKDSKIIGGARFRSKTQQLTIGAFESSGGSPILCDNTTLGQLLKNYGDNSTTEHYAYFDAAGQPILDVLESTVFPTQYKAVTIGECHHEGAGVCTYEHNNGTETHTLTCHACGYSMVEECGFGAYKTDGTYHWQTCDACQYEKMERHILTYEAAVEGYVIAISGVCTSGCGYEAAPGAVTLIIPELTYGKTKDQLVTWEINSRSDIIKLQAPHFIVDGQKESYPSGYPLPELTVGQHTLSVSVPVAKYQENLVFADCSVSFTVSLAPLTEDMVTLTPESVTYSGTAQMPTVAVQQGEATLIEGTDYEVSYSDNENAGTAAVTVTGKGNYTGTVTKTFTIEKARPDTDGLAASLFYGQKLSESTVTGSAINPNNPSVTVTGKLSWATPNAQPTGEGVELFTATFTPDDTGNYTEVPMVSPAVTVKPAAPEITLTAPSHQKAGQPVTVTCTAKNRYDGTMDDVPAVTLTYKVGDGAPQTITGGSFTIPDTANVGDLITITATTAADGQKYLSASAATTVTVTDKTPVEITGVSVTERPYNGDVIGLTGVPVFKTLEGAPVTVDAEDVTYTWSSGDAPVNAGSYTLVIMVGGDTYIGTLSLDFTIAKAVITITAEDQFAVAGSAMPELTYTVSGLASGETLKTEPTPACGADMDTVGSYPITLAGAEVPDGGNYEAEIIYVEGTLTVTAPPVPDDGDSGSTYVPFNPGTPSTTPTTPTVTVPVSGDAHTVRVSASVSGSAATVSKIDTTQLENVISGSAQASMVEIDFTGLGRAIDTVHLPTEAITEIASAAQNEIVGGLTVKLSDSEISFDGDALAAIQAQAGSQVTLTVTPAKGGDLNARQKEVVGRAPVYDLTLRSNGRAITDFRGGYVTASLPYALAAGQDPSGVVVYYLDSMGNVTPCATTYDAGRQAAVFTTGHLSLYFVGYDAKAIAWVNPFSDAAEGAWYYDAVRFVNENGLMNGYSTGIFGPNNYLSRAMLAQILYNWEGAPAVTGGGAFTDAVPGQWYTSAVTWAAANGIVGGYGDGRFGPNDNITREQLAVMLWRYAGSPAAGGKELAFHDADRISGYALDAVRWAVENGILTGYGDGLLGPQGLATRAQAAQMLKNYMGQ